MTLNNTNLLSHFSLGQMSFVDFSAPGLTKPGSRCWPTRLLSGGSGKILPLRSCRLLAESSSLWLSDCGPCFPAGCQLGAILSFCWLLCSSPMWPVHLRDISSALTPSLPWNLYDFPFSHISYFLLCCISLTPAGETPLLLGLMIRLSPPR